MLWFAIGAIAMLIFGSLVTFASYGIYSYANRSTPMKTLDGFCSALLHDQFETAYDHLSRRLQNTLTEQDFATLFQRSHIVDCTHGTAPEDGSKAATSTDMKFVFASESNTVKVTLVKDANSNWKINDLTTAT
jgi:hypothetical protein